MVSPSAWDLFRLNGAQGPLQGAPETLHCQGLGLRLLPAKHMLQSLDLPFQFLLLILKALKLSVESWNTCGWLGVCVCVPDRDTLILQPLFWAISGVLGSPCPMPSRGTSPRQYQHVVVDVDMFRIITEMQKIYKKPAPVYSTNFQEVETTWYPWGLSRNWQL